MPLANELRATLDGLSDDWTEARFALRFRNEEEAARASARLGVLNPVRHGNTVWLTARREGGVDSPGLVARALARLDRERLRGALELVESSTANAEAKPATAVRRSLAAAWDDALAALPPDWTDIFAEVELTSTDDLDRAALLLSPLNPARDGDRPAFRFRSARRFGYGTAPDMVRRCLERLDEEGIAAGVRILQVLSDTKPGATQGPVLLHGGKHF